MKVEKLRNNEKNDENESAYKEEVMSEFKNDNYIGIDEAAKYLGVKTSQLTR